MLHIIQIIFTTPRITGKNRWVNGNYLSVALMFGEIYLVFKNLNKINMAQAIKEKGGYYYPPFSLEALNPVYLRSYQKQHPLCYAATG